MSKTIGIMGGMGPEATLYMYELIIKNTKVQADQDHIPVIIWSNPKVPPRTDAIFGTGPSPVPLLIEGVKILMQAGADFIVMPCITAHYFIPEVRDQIDFPFISLLDESLKWAKRNIPGLKTAGILSSSGTLKSRLFHETFASAGIDILPPTDEEQERVMGAIFGKKGIKAGYTAGSSRETIISIAQALIMRGVQAVIAGCTEIPLVISDSDIPVPLIEPMSIAAEACIREAGYEFKPHTGVIGY